MTSSQTFRFDIPEETVKFWLSNHREPTFQSHGRPVQELRALRHQEIETMTSGLGPKERRERLRKIDDCRRLTLWQLFPFNSLPDDIILHIFYLGTFSIADNIRGSTMPIVYSHVCRRWRGMVLHSPLLWSYIGFKDKFPYTLTQAFLYRSRNASLIIYLRATDPAFDYEMELDWPNERYLLDRMSLLLPHIHRWKSFHCQTDNWAPLSGVISLLQNLRAPILERLQLEFEFENVTRSNIMQKYQIFKGGAPLLQKINLTSTPLDWSHLSRLRTSQLTELALYGLSLKSPYLLTPYEFWSILNNSPNLRKLVLNGAGPKWDNETFHTLPPIYLPSLEEVTLQGREFDADTTLDYIKYILGFLTPVPSLRYLGVGGFKDEENFDHFLPVLRRYFSNIKSLWLAEMPIEEIDLAKWLTALPLLTEIGVFGGELEIVLCNVLSTRPSRYGIRVSPDIFCPYFTTYGAYKSIDEFSDMVLARSKMRAPLSAMIFNINIRATIEADRELMDFMRSGICFRYEGMMFDPAERYVGPGVDRDSLEQYRASRLLAPP